MKIAICDDEAYESRIIEQLIAGYALKTGYDLETEVFNNPEKLLKKEKYDLYFLDYIMPEMNGVELALALREKFNNAVTVCFLTSYNNAAVDVINKGVAAQAFLTKPVNENALFEILDTLYNKSMFNRLVLTQDRRRKTVYPQDIIYVEAVLRKSVFTFFDSKEEFRYTLSELENGFLPKNIFFKIHRSYIVNMLHVDSFNSREVTMKNGDVLPLTQFKEFKSAYTKLILDI
ncbi:MAG: LytTR family DNA-binding domain-containing protein [Clostridia bacterium]|nr:LytTR family DNA-binding domain-containing protein [Clostridia bacterium]